MKNISSKMDQALKRFKKELNEVKDSDKFIQNLKELSKEETESAIKHMIQKVDERLTIYDEAINLIKEGFKDLKNEVRLIKKLQKNQLKTIITTVGIIAGLSTVLNFLVNVFRNLF